MTFAPPPPPPVAVTAASRWLRLPAILLAAVALRAGLLVAGVVPFNADEAVVGLMARHILQGERPVFFYGQAYLGSLDAWLIAGAFALLGQSVLAIRLVQILLLLGTVATTYWLGLRIYGSAWIAGAAALLMAVPTVFVTLYTTVTLGGYGEALLIGNLLLLLALYLCGGGLPSQKRPPLLGWLLLGALGGLGFWSFPLTLVYFVPVMIAAGFMLGSDRRALAYALALSAAGFALGAAPWIAYTATHGLVTVTESAGTVIAGASAQNPVFAVFQHLFNFLLFGTTVVWGMRPPWSAQFLALPLIPFAIALNSAVWVFTVRQLRGSRDRATLGRWLLMGVASATVAGFILTPFGADPTGRYFLPLCMPLALFMAEMLHWLRLRRRRRRTPGRKWFGQALALGLVAFNWWGNLGAAAQFPPGLTTQFDPVAQVDQRAMAELMAFLKERGETRGYTAYWVAFPLAFLSHEELIFTARLPYHLDFRYSARDDRYPAYSELVAASPRVAYITARHPPLDQHLRRELAQLGVEFTETDIGEFHVFHGLSRKVIPDELELGQDCCPN